MAVSIRQLVRGLRRSSTSAVFGIAAGVGVAFASSTVSSAAHFLEFRVQELTTGYDQTFLPAGVPQPLWTSYTISGLPWGTTDFNISGFVNGSPDLPPPSALMMGLSLTFLNQTSSTLEFIVRMTLHNASSMGLNSDWVTSSSWSLAGPSNASLLTLPGMPLWATYIDGNVVATMYDDPHGMSAPGNLSAPAQSGLWTPVMDSIGIELAFSISGNSAGGPTGGFHIVAPAPGAVALLGFGLLGMNRRRRA
jgi:hypothetical protein